jgi:hypothetical protein
MPSFTFDDRYRHSNYYPLEGMARMVTLKGALTNQYSPRRRKGRRGYDSIRFPLRGRKTDNNMPSLTKDIVQKCILRVLLLSLLPSHCRFFLFWPLTRKESIFSLRALCVSSPGGTGGEKHSITYSDLLISCWVWLSIQGCPLFLPILEPFWNRQACQ